MGRIYATMFIVDQFIFVCITFHCFIKKECSRGLKCVLSKQTEQNIRLFRHSAYIAHSPSTNTAWGKKRKKKKKQHKVNN